LNTCGVIERGEKDVIRIINIGAISFVMQFRVIVIHFCEYIEKHFVCSDTQRRKSFSDYEEIFIFLVQDFSDE